MEERTGWLTAAAALLTPLSVILVRWLDRRDKTDALTTTTREARENSVFVHQGDLTDRVVKEVADLREQMHRERQAQREDRERWEADRARLEADRQTGWDTARGWNNLAHTINHELNNALNFWPEASRPEKRALPTFLNVARVEEGKER